MKERPILFSAPMVLAILDGRKTQTRRVAIKTSQPRNVYVSDFDPEECKVEIENKHSGKRYWKACPYGQPGDRLWVREAFSGPHCMDASDGCKAVPPSKWGYCSRIWYWADGNPTDGDWTRPRPSIHMPRWASRILLEVTAVRVERLQDISEADAIAEGLVAGDPAFFGIDHPIWLPREGSVCSYTFAPDAYQDLWVSINGRGSWDSNPWVWVVEFRRAQP